jgi:hypothetical protein
MAPIDIGGDTSVKWVFTVEHAREAFSSDSFRDVPWPGRAWSSNGVDLTDPDGRAYDFAIVIKIPQQGDAKKAFASQLARAAKDAEAAAKDKRKNQPNKVTIILPVEDHLHTESHKPTEDQIHIEWNPSPLRPSTVPRPRSAPKRRAPKTSGRGGGRTRGR